MFLLIIFSVEPTIEIEIFTIKNTYHNRPLGTYCNRCFLFLNILIYVIRCRLNIHWGQNILL